MTFTQTHTHTHSLTHSRLQSCCLSGSRGVSLWPGPTDSSQRKRQAVVLPLRDDVAQGVAVCR